MFAGKVVADGHVEKITIYCPVCGGPLSDRAVDDAESRTAHPGDEKTLYGWMVVFEHLVSLFFGIIFPYFFLLFFFVFDIIREMRGLINV